MKILTAIIFTILLITTTTITKAQDTQPGNALPPTVSKFNDIVEANYSYVADNNGSAVAMGFSNIFAYKYTDHFSAGIGIGLEAVPNSFASVPLSVDLRYYFNPAKTITPFFNLSGGYAFNFDNGGQPNENDVFAGLNFGANIIVTKQVSLQFSLGCAVNHFGSLSDEHSYTDYLSVPYTIGLSF